MSFIRSRNTAHVCDFFTKAVYHHIKNHSALQVKNALSFCHPHPHTLHKKQPQMDVRTAFRIQTKCELRFADIMQLCNFVGVQNQYFQKHPLSLINLFTTLTHMVKQFYNAIPNMLCVEQRPQTTLRPTRHAINMWSLSKEVPTSSMLDQQKLTLACVHTQADLGLH